MNRLIKPGRLAALIFITILLVAIYTVTLYKLQIVEGAAYYERSQNSIVTTKRVTAARGDILDRYGRLLVSNRVCNNLIINTDKLFKDPDPNSIILEMAGIVRECGDTYTDTLPVTAAPFEYVSNMTDLQKNCLSAYLKNNSLPENTTAVELMAFMRSRYKIDNNYNSEETRTIAGIRYELNIRYIVNTADYVFAEDVGIDLITKLKEGNFPGIDVEVSFIREYKTEYAAHILGYTGPMYAEEYEDYKDLGYYMDAFVGKDGVELAFEEFLHGQDGMAAVTSTATGTVTNTLYTQEPVPGNHVYLTIDIGLQEKCEQALASGIQSMNAEREISNAAAIMEGRLKDVLEMASGGAIAVVNVKTGEPLALASYPTFNLKTFNSDFTQLANDESRPLFNRALQGTYAPGSTFKMVTALACLEEGIITTETTYYDEGVFRKYEGQGYAPRCWLYGAGSHGNVNVTSAIEHSCNYFFYTISDFLGIDRMSEYAFHFGLGLKSGIELPESAGVMSTQEYKETVIGEPWRQGDTLQAGMGQAFSQFTPLQIAAYVGMVANGGTRYSSSILKTVRSYDFTEKIYHREPDVLDTLYLDDSYYQAVWAGMRAVTKTGTAMEVFRDYPMDIAAKTGTAQLGAERTNNAVFVCYAPYDDPQIAIAIVIEKGVAGSRVAFIAKEILDYYFSFVLSTMKIENEGQLLQ